MLRAGSVAAVLAIVPLLLAASPVASSQAEGMIRSQMASVPEDLSFNEQHLVDSTTRGPFSGFNLDSNTHVVTIYETPTATASDEEAVRQLPLPAGYSLQFQQVQRGWAELTQVQQNVPNLLPQELRPLLVKVETIPSTNGLAITLTSIPAGTSALLGQAFGPIPIQLKIGSPVTANVSGQTRFDEGSGPWHGGDEIAVTDSTYNTAHYIYNAGCTGGFVLNINGIRYMTSAGHCGTGGGNSHVEQYTGFSGHYIGDVQHRSYNDAGAWDTEYFSGSGFSSAIWTSDNAGAQVKGTDYPRSGAPLCLSGAFHGTNCGYAEGGTTQCVTVSGVYTCHLGELGVNGPGRGDSGGPVYASTTGGVLAVGTDVGGDSIGNEYYTTIGDIESHWGGSVVTG